jgi:hypothetical protein
LTVYHMKELDEVIGVLHSIEETEDGILALVGRISVLLSAEMARNLRSMIGCRIGILKLSGYHVRRL